MKLFKKGDAEAERRKMRSELKAIRRARQSREKPKPERAARPESDFYKSAAWRQIRYLALRNTDGRCGCCGASAADGVRIHVDHVIPRSQRPDLALCLDNLQVLCEDCNAGKGGWDSTDWRR